MLEEAINSDLLPLCSFLSGQEIHKLMQAMKAADDYIKSKKDEYKKKLEEILKEVHITRLMRQEFEKEFIGVNEVKPEMQERSHVGEEGCDLKHCFLAFCYNAELAEKYARLLVETEEKEKALEMAINHLRGMKKFKNMAFNIRKIIRKELGVDKNE